MLEYFDDYAWNLALGMALDMGANMDEIDRASRTLRERSTQDDSDPAKAFFHAWADAAAQLVEKAELDQRNGNSLSASEKYRRAAILYITVERMPPHDYAPRIDAYDRLLACFSRYVSLGGVNCERVLVPYEGSVLPALFVRAPGDGPAPCMVHFNGLDGLKEFLFLSGFPAALARRGVSTLVVDNPGVGEALRKHDLHNFAEAERPAAACVDYLEGRGDVDAARIGMVALSMGGHHAPRAAAFESRFKCCVAWGANHDFAARFRRRVDGATDPGLAPSVPHLVEHILWVFGAKSIAEALPIAERFTLERVLDRIRVPILITHGELDRQISVEDAYRTYDGCINSPHRELRIFTAQEGGEQHCSIGNMSLATDFMADWIADVLVRRSVEHVKEYESRPVCL
ncbi:alpha/beta hydrolase family protein [Burkholderia pyrrocinia]|uniref:alpha/beta hydrolase family protein n=1 Tax=Burkholderia pyrrocinia TaxID=60550 RepID=UPI001BCD2E0E|nr:alpha/beta fold hydrolase [Burkholderia pyrrocinia]QVN19382.1 alpha/beta hydrolase [Burkholderia pyrrocinia]